MKTRIIIDSTTDLPAELRERFLIQPLTVHFGSASYQDGVTITHRTFYEKLVESDVLPTTSQPAPQDFTDLFAQIAAAGEQAVVLTIAAELSGTFQSAMIAAADYPEHIFVVDSGTVTIGAGILAEYALSLADAGVSAREIADALLRAREDVHVIALLDTLEYLKRGGRISSMTALAGGILSIKPVISVRHGEIRTLGKAHGSRQGNNLLIREIESAGGVDFGRPVLLGYTGLSDVLLQKYIADSAQLWEGRVKALRYTCVGSVVGTHAGPGAIAVAFFKDQR